MPAAAKSRASRSGAAAAHVALLRGVNVGGKNILPMAALAEIFVQAGCGDVKTYIQSGNVVFRATPALARRIGDAVQKQISKRFGFESPVLVRTGAEMKRVAAGNPFLKAGADPVSLHVAFLLEEPAAGHVAGLDPNRSPGDSFAVRGREVYLHLPNGAGRTKLTNAYLDSKLATVSSGRNWRTVLQLLELTRAMG